MKGSTMNANSVFPATILAAGILAGDASATAIEEVVVTARKRAESLTDTTYSVAALSGEMLDKFGASNFNDVAETTPNLSIEKSNVGVPRVTMRGIGSLSTLNTFELAVGLAIDGAYFTNAHWFQSGLFDIEQIEVLRGPQGVDFGKNTTAGLINVRTRNPGHSFDANAKFSYEKETEEELIEIGVSGPLTDKFAARLALQTRQNSGYQQRITGEESPNLDRDMGRLTLNWDPYVDVGIIYKLFGSQFETVGLGSELVDCDEDYLQFLRLIGGTDNCIADDILYAGELIGGVVTELRGEEGQEVDLLSQTLSIEWDFENALLVSTTSYQSLDAAVTVDTDYSDPRFIDTGLPEDLELLSQEFRLSFPVGDRLYSVLGIFYERMDKTKETWIDLRIPPGPLGDSLRDLLGLTTTVPGFSFKEQLDVENKTTAFFGDVTWDITDTLSLNFGLRYNIEKKVGVLNQEVGDLGNPEKNEQGGETLANQFDREDIDNFSDSLEFRHLDPSFTAKWNYGEQFSFDFLNSGQLYATYKEGYKSGGFDQVANVDENGQPATPFVFDDETVSGYELGTKIEAWNRRIRLSMSVFRSVYDDLQIQFLPSGSTLMITTNAGSSITQGVESDLLLAVTERIRLTAAAAYTDAHYDSFNDAPCYSAQSEDEGCVDGKQNLSGETLAYAPKRSGNLGFEYNQPFFDAFMFSFNAQVSYAGELHFNVFSDPNTERSSLTTYNASASLGGIDDGWAISVIGRNLSNERPLATKQTAPLSTLVASEASYYGALNPPRTIALQVSLNL